MHLGNLLRRRFACHRDFELTGNVSHPLQIRMRGAQPRLHGGKLGARGNQLRRRAAAAGSIEGLRLGRRCRGRIAFKLTFGFAQLPLDERPPIGVAAPRVGQRLNLQLHVLNHLQVRGKLRRQFAREPASILLELGFVLDQALACIGELRLQKTVGAFRQLLPVAEVLFDEERRQAVRHSHHGLRIVANVGNAKRIALDDDLDVDVPAHILDDGLHELCAPLDGVEVEIANDPLEPGTAENLLCDRLQPVLDFRGDRRLDVGLGDTLRQHENQRFRSVPVRQEQRPGGSDGRDDGNGRQHQAGSPPQDQQHVVNGQPGARQHGSLSSRPSALWRDEQHGERYGDVETPSPLAQVGV